MKLLRYESTQTVMVGPICKSSDGHSRSTALSLTTAPAIRLSKDGSTYGNRGDTGAVTARYGGYYTVPLSTVDTGTYGHLRLIVQTSSGHLPCWEDFWVGSTDTWDFLASNVMEPGLTHKEMMRVNTAVLAGISTGAGSTTLKFMGASTGTTGVTRINAACGSSGNRKSVTINTSS